jgi:hypothetical protein
MIFSENRYALFRINASGGSEAAGCSASLRNLH